MATTGGYAYTTNAIFMTDSTATPNGWNGNIVYDNHTHTSGTYFPPIPIIPPPQYPSINPNPFQNPCQQYTPQTEKVQNMRGLYEVFAVDSISGVIRDVVLVAKDADSAKLKAFKALEIDGDIDDYDFVVREIGKVRAKKEVSEVRVIKDGDK